jgi:hypothetical protein
MALTKVNSILVDGAINTDASGNVGIGVTSPTQKLDVSGTIQSQNNAASNDSVVGAYNFYNTNPSASANPIRASIVAGRENSAWGAYLKFNTSTGTSAQIERMSIDSSGQLLVNRTSAEGSSTIVSKALSTDSYQGFNTNNSFTFAVSGSGTIYAVNTAVQTISDIRLKENIQDIDVGLDAVMQLKPRKFDWKAGKGKDIKGDIGWVAQEFEQVFPKMIGEWREPAPQGEEPYKSIGADLMPILVKAIQEQQAIITDLKARIETLEAK